MSIIKSTTKVASVLGVAGLALSLAACSGGQSVAEACKIANETVAEANTNLESTVTEVMGGNADMNELFAPIKQSLKDAESKISNSEVSDALKGISGDFTSVSELLGDFKLPDLTDLDVTNPEDVKKFEDLQKQSESMLGDLESVSNSLQESGTKLQELCG